MAMRFENSYLLPCLLFVLVPALFFILRRYHAPVVSWPTFRFLLQAHRRHAKRLRLLEALLLGIRTLIILFVVLAVMRPFAKNSTASTRNTRGVLVVIDTSLSMTCVDSDSGTTSFERARSGAVDVLASLTPFDQVVVLAASGAGRIAEEGVGQRPPTAVVSSEQARDHIARLTADGPTFSLLDAVEEASIHLSALTSDKREIWVFSDLAENVIDETRVSEWRLLKAQLESKGLPLATLRVIDCGASTATNHFLWNLSTPLLAATAATPTELTVGVARSSTRVPSAGSGSAAALPQSTPQIGGAAAGDTLRVRLATNIKELSNLAVAVDTAGRGVATVESVFDAGGVTRLVAELPGDALAADNRRHELFLVRDAISVLVVGTTPREIGTARYVELALRPGENGSAAEHAATALRHEFAATLETDDIDRHDVVVVCDLPTLDRTSMLRLQEFVRRGGGLILFCGGQLPRQTWNRLAFRRQSSFLPARLARRVEADGGGSGYLRLEADEHPALAPFTPPDQGDLDRVSVLRWTVFEEVRSDAKRLISNSHGGEVSPWLIEKEYGDGRVILFASAPEPLETPLPRTPLFLPLLHQVVRHAAHRSFAGRHVTCGEPLRFDLSAHRRAEASYVVDPNGTKLALEIEFESGRLIGRVNATATPGFYAAHLGGELGDVDAVEWYAVNFPVAESRLERVADDALRTIREAAGFEVETNVNTPLEVSVDAAARQEYWPFLIGAVLILLVCELACSRLLVPPNPSS